WRARNIIKKLPRKTAVHVNDTAVFCVELDNECQKIRWLKNKEEVQPSDRITITCSGKQHTMIIRECKKEDAGEIAFLADESRTSTQFTVTSKVHFYSALLLCFPQQAGAPILAVFSPNGALVKTSVTLAWSPPKTDRPLPIDGYVVERKKLMGFTWVRCHESPVPDLEFTMSNLSEEADYQFRVSAVNAYGQSPCLEFPGSVHLAPIVAVKTPLTTAEVVPGGDATFTVDLTTTCSGTWYLNGKVLQESKTCIIKKTQTTHTLIIKNVTKNDDGAEVKFVAGNVDTSTNMRVRGIYFDLCFSSSKGTVEITANKKFSLEDKGKVHKLVASAVTKEDEGTYTCKIGDDTLTFDLKVSGKLMVKIWHEVVSARLREEAKLQAELSDADAAVKWLKDGKELKKFSLEDKGKVHKLVASAVTKEDEGTYTCKIGDDTLTFDLKVSGDVFESGVKNEVKAAPKRDVMLSCEVAQGTTEVKWYKEGKLITSSKKFKVESEGKSRRLVLSKVEEKDAGEYTCEAAGQKLTFRINITGKSDTP
uniref:Obscurin, cytoskeletal calmodulin and titin-interacting RhoGEF b n=1 Tax=Nothoprocta perdicaria TaxID=30464 RepID=A0A8C6ZGG2_NOTPE